MIRWGFIRLLRRKIKEEMIFTKKLLPFILCLLVCDIAQAVEFTNFKYNYNQPPETISNQKMGLRSQKASPSVKSVPILPILDELGGLLGNSYSTIGEEQVKKLMENYNLGGGVLNFSGFTWYKPMLNYHVSANRELAPDFNSEQWIIHDTFKIHIDALTLLHNFREQDIIDITDKQMQAFAGLSFTRTYHYYHFANEYLDGLSKDYSKLFLSFQKFNPQGVAKLDEYEIMRKNDELNFHAGAGVSIPTNAGMIGAGVVFSKSSTSSVQVHKVGKSDQTNKEEYLKVTTSKEKATSSAGRLSLEQDFFNLINLTLFKLEFKYEYTLSDRTDLTLSKNNYEKVTSDIKSKDEFNNILKGKTKVQILKPYIISKEQREKEDYNSTFSFLLLGSMKKRAMEQINIIKDGVEKTFFKAYAQSVSYVQNFLSRVFSIVIRKIFDFDTTVSNVSELKKELQIEYEKVENLGAMEVENESEFSVRMSFQYAIDKTHRWYHYIKYKAARKYAKNYSYLDDEILRKIKNKSLRGPLRGSTTFEAGESSIYTLLNQTDLHMENSFITTCDLTKREIKKVRSGRYESDTPRLRCFDLLARKYLKFKKDYNETKIINLKLLKSFLGSYLQRAKNISDIHSLFGEEIFIHGSFSAKTKSGAPFQTFYNTGQFEGIGVIEQFRNR